MLEHPESYQNYGPFTLAQAPHWQTPLVESSCLRALCRCPCSGGSGAQPEVELDGKTFTRYAAAALVDDLRHAEAGTVVAYENAVFEGSFHLSDQIGHRARRSPAAGCRFVDPVSFDWSVFGAAVDGERVQFEQGASLLGTTFLSDCKLADSRFGGQARFKRVRFAGEALFDNSVLSVAISLGTNSLCDIEAKTLSRRS